MDRLAARAPVVYMVATFWVGGRAAVVLGADEDSHEDSSLEVMIESSARGPDPDGPHRVAVSPVPRPQPASPTAWKTLRQGQIRFR